MSVEDGIIASHQLDILVDHGQFWLDNCDRDKAFDDLNILYSSDALARHLGAAPGLLVIFTARHYGNVRLTILLRANQPTDNFTSWDNVAEGSIELPSGRLAVYGPESYPPASPPLALPRGVYRVRVYAGGIEALEDEFMQEGPDHYRAVFWPAPYEPPALLHVGFSGPW